MLVLAFRGFFILGILYWYSSNVWKMIDDYFKNQFQRYLDEEYRKNPKMREDVVAYAGKADPDVTATLGEPRREVRQVLETCSAETCPVGMSDSDGADSETSAHCGTTGCSDENEVAKASTDKNAFLEKVGIPSDVVATSGEISESTGSAAAENASVEGREESTIEAIAEKANETEDFAEYERAIDSKVLTDVDKKARSKKKIAVGESIERRKKSAVGRQRVKTITLTELDFNSVKRRGESDFSEFDVDEDELQEMEHREGVLISELYYKPKADIGDSERVSPEEYCPLSVEEEVTCGDTAEWP